MHQLTEAAYKSGYLASTLIAAEKECTKQAELTSKTVSAILKEVKEAEVQPAPQPNETSECPSLMKRLLGFDFSNGEHSSCAGAERERELMMGAGIAMMQMSQPPAPAFGSLLPPIPPPPPGPTILMPLNGASAGQPTIFVPLR